MVVENLAIISVMIAGDSSEASAVDYVIPTIGERRRVQHKLPSRELEITRLKSLS